MTTERVRTAAAVRGIYFDGVKKWRNNMVDCAYEVMTGLGFFQSDTLEGLYRYIMKFEKVKH